MGFSEYEGELRLEDIVNGLKDGLLNISFENSDGNGVYPTEIKQLDSSSLNIEMSNGSFFILRIDMK